MFVFGVSVVIEVLIHMYRTRKNVEGKQKGVRNSGRGKGEGRGRRRREHCNKNPGVIKS